MTGAKKYLNGIVETAMLGAPQASGEGIIDYANSVSGLRDNFIASRKASIVAA